MYNSAFMVPVESSQLAAIGYDKQSGQAYVRFVDKGRGGALYEYDAVPEGVVTDIINAESVGRQFNLSLKYGFSYRRIE